MPPSRAQQPPCSPTCIPTVQRHSTSWRTANSRELGVELGRLVGRLVVARGRTDGSDAVWTGTVPTGPGLWVPTPPGFAPPLEPLTGTWRPWNLTSGSQFRPGPQPAFGSAEYAREVQEVYDVSLHLTAEQRAIALFWADGAGTVTPPGHWSQIALDLLRAHRLDTRRAAWVLAAVNTAQADAFIACWDAKFTYWSERPITAIRREHDAGWLPLIATPPFPSYVSGHSTTSGAASECSLRSSRRRPRTFARWPRRPPSPGSTAASTSAATTSRGSCSARRSREWRSRGTESYPSAGS